MLPPTDHLRALAVGALQRCGVAPGSTAPARTPITGEGLGAFGAGRRPRRCARPCGRRRSARGARHRRPSRGEVVRRFGNLVRDHLDDLATLISVEVGKITAEARGEVQEVIDVCDFAVGLSRQLYGRSIASERPAHRLTETWQPLGPVGVVTAFNFPAAVWAWNAAIALVARGPGGVEAEPVDAAHRARLRRAAATGAAERAARSRPGRARRRRRGGGDGRRRSPAVAQRHRLDGDGRGARPARRRRASGGACWSSAGTTRRSSPRRPTSR